MLVTQKHNSVAVSASEVAFVMRRAKRRYWSGLSVGWFVLALAIFYWGLHYRLQQYQSARMHGSVVPVAKMWLGERSYTATPAGVHSERGPQFPVLTTLLALFLILYPRIIFLPGKTLRRSGISPPRWTQHCVLFSRPPPAYSF